MDTNTTVAVDIMVRTSMAGAQNDFSALLSRMEDQVRQHVASMQNLLNQSQANTVKATKSQYTQQEKDLMDYHARVASARRNFAVNDYKSQLQSAKDLEDGIGASLKRTQKLHEDTNAAILKSQNAAAKALKVEDKANNATPGVIPGKGLGVFGSFIAAAAVLEAIDLAEKLGSKLVELGIDSVKAAAQFEVIQNSVAIFAGGSKLAAAELRDLDAAARETPGLELLAAEKGYQRLRALNFQAQIAQDFIIGIGKQALISGADEGGVSRFILALQKLKASSANAGFELRAMFRDLPSAALVLQKTFGTIDAAQIKRLIDANPDEFFSKFSKGLKDTEVAAPGATAAWISFENAILESKRAFGQPILDPVTHDIRDLTSYLYSNLDTWKTWGQQVSDIIRGLPTVASGVASLVTSSPAGTIARSAGVSLPTLLLSLSPIGQAALVSEAIGAGQRQHDEPLINLVKQKAEAAIRSNALQRPGFNVRSVFEKGLTDQQNVDAVKEVSQEIILESAKRIGAYQHETEEKEKQVKEQISLSKEQAATEAEIAKRAADVQIAVRGVPLRNTPNEERAYQADITAIRERSIRDQSRITIRGIEEQVAEMRKFPQFFDIKAIEKVEDQKGKIQKDSQLQIQAVEAEAARKRLEIDQQERQAQRTTLIEWNNLQLQSLKQVSDARAFDVQRQIDETGTGYDQLKQITIQNAEDTENAIRANLATQVQDERLTQQQIFNLRYKAGLDIQAAEEQRREKLIQIQKSELDERRRLITEFFNSIVDVTKSEGAIVNTGIDLAFSERLTGAQSGNIVRSLISGGTDQLASLRDQMKQLLGYKANLQAAQANIGGDLFQQIFGTGVADLGKIDTELDKINRQFSDLANNVRDVVDAQKALGPLWMQLQELYKNFTPTPEGVDKFRADELRLRQQNERESLSVQIQAQTLHRDNVDPKERQAEQYKLDGLIIQQRQLGITQLKEQNDLYEKSIQGLTDYNQALASGEVRTTAFAQNKAITARLAAEGSAMENIIALTDKLYNSKTLDSLEIQAAAIQNLIDLQHKHTQAIIDTNTATRQIADQTVFHGDEANAKVLQFMASQKGVTDIMADFRIGMMQTGYDYIDKGLDKVLSKMGLFGNLIKDLVSSFAKLLINAAFRSIFGLDGQATGGSGGVTSGGGIGAVLSALTGGRGGGSSAANSGGFGGVNIGGGFFGPSFGGSVFPGGTAGFNPNAGLGIGGGALAIDPITGNLHAGPGISGDAGGHGVGVSGVAGFGGTLGAAFAPILPMLGLSLGAQLGGGKGLSGILGGVGGLLAGGVGAAALLGTTTGVFAAGGSLAFLAPLLTNPFTAIAAGGLILGAILLKKAAQRRADEKVRAQAVNDAVAQITQLINDVKTFKIDGASAIQQGAQIRANYIQAVSQLKDGKTRNIAMQELSQRIDPLLATLKTESDKATSAQNVARSTDTALVPTFAMGGFVPGRGPVPVVAHGGEAYLTQANIMALGGYRALQDAGVRGISMSGAPDTSPRGRAVSIGSNADDRPIYVIAAYSDEHADQLFDMVSPHGVAKKVKVASKHDLQGMNDQLARSLAGEG